MPSVTFYREIISKSSPTLFGGVKLPYRSLRASWAKVHVRIDGSTELVLRQSIPVHLELEPGKHTIEAGGIGFKGARLTIDMGESASPIVVISPQHRVGATDETPLGTLVIREESDARNLLPYAFYESLPTSFPSKVLHSVFFSMLLSAAFFLLGVSVLVAIPVGFITKGDGAGLFVLVLGSVIASVFIPAGLGGVVIGIRFLRLPQGWRNPQKTAADGT